MGNFNTLLRIVEELAKDMDCEFAGAVLRPHAYLLRRESETIKKVLDALKQVGFELVNSGVMPQDLLEIGSQPLISEEEYRNDLTNGYLELKNR